MRASGQAADVYAAIADKTRRALLVRLAREGERSVTELLGPFSISQPAISKHLRILREAGLVRSRQDGRSRLYRIEANKLRTVFDWVSFFEKFWDDKLDALGEHLDKKHPKKKR
jgi:DNA-binding transcriptional ArsR family regulator